MNEEMAEEEKATREYMNLVLTNLAQGEQIGNISIFELAKLLHGNDEEMYDPQNNPYEFASREFNCKTFCCNGPYAYGAALDYYIAWTNYYKAYFAY